MLPHSDRLLSFVTCPPSRTCRLHCTMIRHDEEQGTGYYTLYLEYLGGLIPLLKGRRVSKLKPEFIVFDPKLETFDNKLSLPPLSVAQNVVDGVMNTAFDGSNSEFSATDVTPMHFYDTNVCASASDAVGVVMVRQLNEQRQHKQQDRDLLYEGELSEVSEYHSAC